MERLVGTGEALEAGTLPLSHRESEEEEKDIEENGLYQEEVRRRGSFSFLSVGEHLLSF